MGIERAQDGAGWPRDAVDTTGAHVRDVSGAASPAAGAVGAVILVLAALATLASPARAQESELVEACGATGAPVAILPSCHLAAQAVETVQPRIGLVASGGNPVPGTASTLGMRLGAFPRISVAARATGVWAESPQIIDIGDGGENDFLLTSYNAHAAVGLLEGFSPAPTVGGVGSLDLLGEIGIVPLPSGDGFRDDSPFTWALGARLGILRESFTLPGASITGMYRRVGDVVMGDPQLESTDAFFALDGVSAWSLRGTVGKRLFTFGVTAGAGYDHYSSDVVLGAVDPATGTTVRTAVVEDFENDRYSLFGNLSWTLLILHVVGEVGWQSGADEVSNILPPTAEESDGGAFFGSVAIRISI